MKWPIVIIFAYVCAVVQSGMTSWLRLWDGASPNLLLVMLIFLALHAASHALVIMAVVLGLLSDLTNQTPLGFGVISFAAVALMMLQLRQMVFREHPLSHAALGLICGVVLGVVLLLLQYVRGWFFTPSTGSLMTWGLLFRSAVLTIPACVIMVWLLRKYRGAMGLKRSDFNM